MRRIIEDEDDEVMVVITKVMMMMSETPMVIMMSLTKTRWDSKTYKWSVVVRQEPEAGNLLEVAKVFFKVFFGKSSFLRLFS